MQVVIRSQNEFHLPIFYENQSHLLIRMSCSLRVFVQLEGDCNGVYVTNKTATGFDVVELNNGSSNVSFQWSITANVADAQIGSRTSRFADLRFEPGPVSDMQPLRDAQSQARPVMGLQK